MGAPARRQVRFSAEARQTLPFVTDEYARGQVATIDNADEETDPLEDVDLTTLDDQTIAALYEGLADEPPEEDDQEEEDFSTGS